LNSAAVKITIVVPAFNEEKLIEASLNCINQARAAFHDLAWATELIVCDNNSTDRTAELARSAGAKVVFEPVNQIGRSRNRGAQGAEGEWLVFVDADSRPTRELFADVAAQIRAGKCLAGGCTVRMDRSTFLGDALTGLWNWISRAKRWAAGSFLFCEAAAFRQAGGFNLELFASEEIDLSKRLHLLARAQGKQFVILHQHPLLTSARKLDLYSRKEYLRLFGNLLLHPRKTLRQREACAPWYDGRR
jgi:glycosyltransferase involved in cell wall biosynthesis